MDEVDELDDYFWSSIHNYNDAYVLNKNRIFQKGIGVESIVHLERQKYTNRNKINSAILEDDGSSSLQILCHSDHCVKASVGQKLKTLINSMKTNEFIIGEVSPATDGVTRTDIISQYQHFPNYFQLMPKYNEAIEYLSADENDHNENPFRNFRFDPNFDYSQIGEMADAKPNKRKQLMKQEKIISLAPTMFSVKENKFVTEINGLSHAENIELYTLIQSIFIDFLPMFEELLNIKLSKNSPFDQLSVIIKIQQYDINKECSFNGHWHSEGNENDNIMAVGLYYFDISRSKSFRFYDHCLEVAHKKSKNETVKMKIKENDCMVFKNSDVKHRATFSTKKTRPTASSCHASRSVLSFFLLNPANKSYANTQSSDSKWYNYPWKTDIFVQHLLSYERNICPREVIDLIAVFTFGNFEHRRSELISLVEKYVLTDKNPNEKQPFPQGPTGMLGN